MNIKEAIAALESGKCVARKSWNKEGRFKRYIFVSSLRCDIAPESPLPVLLIRLGERQFQLWTAKPEDEQATDWEIVE